MPNKNAPAGGKIVNALHSANFDLSTHDYVIPATDSQDYWVGEFVKTNNTSENGVPIAIKAAAAEPLRGIITNFKAEREEDDISYRQANTRRVARVSDDPKVLFNIQANGVLTSTDIGQTADLLVAAGSPGSTVSGTQLDTSTIAPNGRQIKIHSIIESPVNELGSYTKVLAMINHHELNQDAGGGVASLSAFLYYLQSNIPAVTGDGTLWTVQADTKLYDLNGDFNPSTGIFTAPFNGIYNFISNFGGTGGTGCSDFIHSYVDSAPTNIPIDVINYAAVKGTTNYVSHISWQPKLNAGDTVNFTVQGSGAGSKIVGAQGSLTNISGSLIALL